MLPNSRFCVVWLGGYGLQTVKCGLQAANQATKPHFAVGYANREVWLGGYGFWKFRGAPTAMHDPIETIATVISDVHNSTVVIAIIDAVGIGNVIHDRIVHGVEAAIGIPADNVLLGATHSHAGLDLQGLWGGASDNYIDWVVSDTISAITEAYDSRREANLYASKALYPYNRNRRGLAYTENEIFVLDARDADSDERITTMIEFAAHTVTLNADNLEFSGDFAHYTREYAAAALGAPVMYVNGPEGDVSPTPIEGEGFERPRGYGEKTTLFAVEMMKEQEQLSGDIYVETKHFEHPLSNPLFLAAFKLGLTRCCYDYAPVGHKLPIPLQTTYLRIGDQLQGVAFPGESLTRNGLPIKEAMHAPFKLFLGLFGGTVGYFVPSDEWDITRYEEQVSIDKMAGDDIRDILLDMIANDNGRN